MTAKDLTQEAPRSPRELVGNYAILGRALDKGRAMVAGNLGDYHFDCPLDNILFHFKEVKGPDVKKLIEDGASDEEVASWLDANGAAKSPEEVKTWSRDIIDYHPYDNPEKRDWFMGVCKETGVDPVESTMFDWLDADDKKTFAK